MALKKHSLILLAIALVAGLVFVGCRAPPAPKEIRIGLPAAMTGRAAGFGEGGAFGYKAAVDDINKLGGIYVEEYGTKLPVKLIVVDTESSPEKAASLAEDLILRDKVNFLVNVGPLDFNPAVAKGAERYKVPHMGGPGPFESWQAIRMEITPPWRYTWIISFAIATPAEEGDFRYGKPGYCMFDVWSGALEGILDKTNKKIALLASDDPDGRGWYHAFAPQAQKIGCETYRTDEDFGLVPMETTDFTSLIDEWKAANCELLWSNSPAPFYEAFAAQAYMLGYHPKQVFATRGGLFYTDIKAWGGDLPNGVCNEMFWHPSIKGCRGIGDTTPMSLHERWVEETGQPKHTAVGWCYAPAQVLFDAIERAGTLDGEAVNKALSETDMITIYHRVRFDENQYSRVPVAFGQWQKTDKPWVWDNPIVYSPHEFMPATADLIFPIPYD